jgi:hypothetical protein
VIRLKHAKAEQLAETLSHILPPGITVVPDRPTNSLVVSPLSSTPHSGSGAANTTRSCHELHRGGTIRGIMKL